MQVKVLIDGVRRHVDTRLSLSRARDLISRLIYGHPYSAAMAAEAAGKVLVASLDSRRVDELFEDYGSIVWAVSAAAAPMVNGLSANLRHLNPSTILEVASLAAQSEAWYRQMQGQRNDLIATNGEDAEGMYEAAKFRLETCISVLSTDEVHELKALYALGRGDDGHDFAEMLRYQSVYDTWADAEYLSRKLTLHYDVVRGLTRLGSEGLAIISLQADLRTWAPKEHPQK